QLRPLGTTGSAGAIRESILRSAAITPTTNALQAAEVTDTALRKMIASVDSGIFLPDFPENAELNKLLGQAPTNKAAAREAFRRIRGGEGSGISFGVNPIEQQILNERRLGMGLPSDIGKRVEPASLVHGNNLFDKLSGTTDYSS